MKIRLLFGWLMMATVTLTLKAQDTNAPAANAPAADTNTPAETTNAPAETVAAVKPPADPQKNLILRFSFDNGIQPDVTTIPAVNATFTRQSSALLDDQPLNSHAPRLVAGKAGKGLLLEDAFANWLALDQAGVETDASKFTATNQATLAITTEQPWQGQQALRVTTAGAGSEEGFLTEAAVEKALYNGTTIVGAHYVAALYLKGQGSYKLYLKDTIAGTNSEPVYINLTDTWQRYVCTYTYAFTAQGLGANHATDWKSYVPKETSINARLQLVCESTDAQKAVFDVDGLQLEARRFPYAAMNSSISPHRWIPGGTEIACEKFAFETSDKLFEPWVQSGSISFWFKPNWDPQDGTHETLIDLAPKLLFLEHMTLKIKLHPAGVEFAPYDWKDNWHHLAVTWTKEGDRVLYVDGMEYPNSSGEQAPLEKAAGLSTSSGLTAAPNGVLDDLMLFQITLTPEQARALAAEELLKPAGATTADAAPAVKSEEKPKTEVSSTSAETKPPTPESPTVAPAGTNAPAASTNAPAGA